MTLCWSAEVIIYACIPADAPAFATTCVTSLVGAALLAVPFRRRIADALRGEQPEVRRERAEGVFAGPGHYACTSSPGLWKNVAGATPP